MGTRPLTGTLNSWEVKIPLPISGFSGDISSQWGCGINNHCALQNILGFGVAAGAGDPQAQETERGPCWGLAGHPWASLHAAAAPFLPKPAASLKHREGSL